jgi:putative (di)nucleoside polyphosphate hydrolase
MSDIYRKAASLVVLRSAGEGYQLLLLHKPRKKDAWQLPQGGVEGEESTEQAALRELKEEAGIEGVMVLGKSPDVYQYDFPQSFRRFRPDNVCGQRIEYIFTLAPEDAVVRVDGKEIDDHVWISLSELSRFVKRKEYLELTEKLYKEAVSVASTR